MTIFSPFFKLNSRNLSTPYFNIFQLDVKHKKKSEILNTIVHDSLTVV